MRKRVAYRWLTVLIFALLSAVGGGPAVHGDTPPRTPKEVSGAFVTQPATAWREVWNAEGTLYAATSPTPDRDTVLWAVGDGGRLMRTRDGGRFWRFSRVPGRPELHALALADATHGWAVGNAGTVVRTEDGGDLWTPVAVPITGTLYIVDLAQERVWIGGEEGLVVSSDGGHSWTRVSSTPVRSWAREATWWAVGTPDGRVLLTGDGGNTWEEHGLGDKAVYALAWCPTAEGKALYAAGDGFLARSLDRGTSWTFIPYGHSYPLFDLACGNENDVWAVGLMGSLYHIRGTTATRIAVDEDFHTLFHIQVLDGDGLWVVGDGPVIWRSDDAGGSWTLQNGGPLVNLYEVDFVDERHGWAVGERRRPGTKAGHYNGVVLHTEDGGESWEVQSLPDDQDYGWLWGLDCVDVDHCWAAGRYGRIFHTADGGRTWQRQYSGTSKWLHEVAFPTLTRGYIGGNYDPVRGHSLFLRTRNGGETWEDMAPPIGLPLYAVDALDAMHVAAASDQGAIIVSHNGGASWIRTNAPHRINLRAITWLDEDNLWVAGMYGYLIHSIDGGRTWLYKEGGGSNHTRDWWSIEFTPDRKVGFVVGGFCPRHNAVGLCYPEDTGYTGGLIGITFNGGRYWTYYTSGTPQTLRDVRVLDRNHAWAVGDAGTILLYRGEPSRTFGLRAPRPPLIDGDTWDWTVADDLVVDAAHADEVRGARPTSDADLRATIAVWWDPSAVYLLARITDDIPAPGDGLTLVLDDSASTPDDTGYITLTLQAPPLPGQRRTGVDDTTGASYAVRREDDRWIAEIRIPASALGGELTHDRIIRWTVRLNDEDTAEHSELIRDGRSLTPNPEFGSIILLDNHVILQSGRNLYSDSVDSWISNEWDKKAQNWWNGRTLHITAGDYRDVLLYFRTDMFPPDLQVEEATLRLFTTEEHGGGGPLTVGVYPLKRPWLFDQVTGLEAMKGVPWGRPGANDTEVDRWATPTDQTQVDATDAWFAWDVTEAVRLWIQDPASNHGVILKSFQRGYNPRYTFASEAHPVAPYEDKHPELHIHYAVPTPAATATPTPTPPPVWHTYVPALSARGR